MNFNRRSQCCIENVQALYGLKVDLHVQEIFFLIILNAVYLSVIPTKLGRNMLNKMICIFANDYLEFAIYFVLGKVISWWMLVNVGPTEINTGRMWGQRLRLYI